MKSMPYFAQCEKREMEITWKYSFKQIEEILYGAAEGEARLPLPDEIIQILQAAG